jgi:hypothetical protein
MDEKLAFTARSWGDSAVVCRAMEDEAGPIIDQQFGEFESWTEAQAFAQRLNEGLDLSTLGARELTTDAALRTDTLRSALNFSQCTCEYPAGQPSVRSNRLQFVLAELDLAVTFCRMVRSRPNSPHTGRMMKNARKALFNTLHFALMSDTCDFCMEAIHPRIEKLRAALQLASAAPGIHESAMQDATISQHGLPSKLD